MSNVREIFKPIAGVQDSMDIAAAGIASEVTQYLQEYHLMIAQLMSTLDTALALREYEAGRGDWTPEEVESLESSKEIIVGSAQKVANAIERFKYQTKTTNTLHKYLQENPEKPLEGEHKEAAELITLQGAKRGFELIDEESEKFKSLEKILNGGPKPVMVPGGTA